MIIKSVDLETVCGVSAIGSLPPSAASGRMSA